MEEKVKLGVVADDFTGASDAASFLTQGGMRTLLCNETFLEEEHIEADAIVVALKTRTQETTAAVKETLEAVKWLEKKGVNTFYIKYCSTFDSTPKGNIGPILDAILDYFGQPYTLLAPSLPVNGRTVEDGKLYVNGQLLHKSPMRNHPLTPMWASEIDELMKDQSQYPVYSIERTALADQNWQTTKYDLEKYKKENKHFYVVPDFVNEEDAQIIIERFGDLKMLSGGSGLLELFAKHLIKQAKMSEAKTISPKVDGAPIMVAGSCSEQTLNQIHEFEQSGGVSYKIYPEKVMSNEQNKDMVKGFIFYHIDQPILIYSSASKEERAYTQSIPNISNILEELLSYAALQGVESGRRQIIVAGGETAGSVMQALDSHSFYISESVSPGVPVMVPTDRQELRVLLKSGNFGSYTFFNDAINLTSDKGEFK